MKKIFLSFSCFLLIYLLPMENSISVSKNGIDGQGFWPGYLFAQGKLTQEELCSRVCKCQCIKRKKAIRGEPGPPGLQGPKGEKGDRGDIGPAGPMGLRGPKGDKGEKGDNGDIGPAGPMGLRGLKGEKGDKGDIGPAGPMGLRGPKGDKGEKGDRGDIGPSGPMGLMGPKGEKGDNGDIGPAGPMGLRGPKGDKGDKGDNGDIGPAGPMGPKGDEGDKGDKGEKGDRGDIGPAGPMGLRGPIGPVGLKGPRGAKGDKGDKGDPGPIGLRGPRGEKGDRGDIGPAGPMGLRGPIGPVGLKGPRGAKGDKGDKGEKGDPGIRPEEIKDISVNSRINAKQQHEIDRLIKKNYEHDILVDKIAAAHKEMREVISKNAKSSSRQDREIFKINTRIKLHGNLINNYKERLLARSRFFKTDEILVTGRLEAGSLAVGTISIKGGRIVNLNVSRLGVIFTDNVKVIKGFSKGTIGQILYIVNTGSKAVQIAAESPDVKQRIKISKRIVYIKQNESITLVCDGKSWRVLNL